MSMTFERPIEPLKKSKELLEAEEADAKLAKSLSPEKKFADPRPATVSPEDAEAFRDSLDEVEERKDNIIKFPKKSEPEGPERKKAA